MMKKAKNTNDALAAAITHAILAGVEVHPDLDALQLVEELEHDARTYDLGPGDQVGVALAGTIDGRPVTVQVRPLSGEPGAPRVPAGGTTVTLTDHRTSPFTVTEWRAGTVKAGA